ncbi:MAG TPA: hypothetical protein VGK24_02375 [Candidatus Angelobacter sp.]|jgi:predicted nucleic acid-binding protein
MISDRPAVMDASSIINIIASGRAEELLALVSNQILICTYVREKECLYLRSEDGTSVEAIGLEKWIEAGILQDCVLTLSEEEQFLIYASQVDDGEAMSLAIASMRGLTLITDDRKAQRLATLDGISVLSTPQIVYAWAATQNQAPVAEVLRAIEVRAKFRPSLDHPLSAWWLAARDH